MLAAGAPRPLGRPLNAAPCTQKVPWRPAAGREASCVWGLGGWKARMDGWGMGARTSGETSGAAGEVRCLAVCRCVLIGPAWRPGSAPPHPRGCCWVCRARGTREALPRPPHVWTKAPRAPLCPVELLVMRSINSGERSGPRRTRAALAPPPRSGRACAGPPTHQGLSASYLNAADGVPGRERVCPARWRPSRLASAGLAPGGRAVAIAGSSGCRTEPRRRHQVSVQFTLGRPPAACCPHLRQHFSWGGPVASRIVLVAPDDPTPPPRRAGLNSDPLLTHPATPRALCTPRDEGRRWQQSPRRSLSPSPPCLRRSPEALLGPSTPAPPSTGCRSLAQPPGGDPAAAEAAAASSGSSAPRTAAAARQSLQQQRQQRAHHAAPRGRPSPGG